MRHRNRSHSIEPIALAKQVAIGNFPTTTCCDVVSGFSAILLS
jgi:hypothetical protein